MIQTAPRPTLAGNIWVFGFVLSLFSL